MKKLITLFLLFVTGFLMAQNDIIANDYFEKGAFEKATVNYADLLKSNPNNTQYFMRLVECYQQQKKFEEAEKLIKSKIEKQKQLVYLVDLGYNFQLQKDQSKADKYYQQAIDKIKENSNLAFSIAPTFEKKSLLKQALLAYETAQSKNPQLKFDMQIGMLYGQMGDFDKMIEKLLDEAYNNQERTQSVQYNLSRYLSEDINEVFTSKLKKQLLLRAQKQQEIFWNQFLSWYFIQQKEFGKAFIQQKAIVKRYPEYFSDIVDLVYMAMDENDVVSAKEIATFILDQTINDDLRLSLQYYLLQNDLKNIKKENYTDFQKQIQQLLTTYGLGQNTLEIQLLSANFEAFYLNKPDEAIQKLKLILDKPMDVVNQSKVKTLLADILVRQQMFNQALIYFAQIELDQKNNPIGHEASLKVAKTSYFKGDFDWALKQFKVLKSSVSLLIANDALEYFLLINDNIQTDSTHTALKKFAHADFTLYCKKYDGALIEFQEILKNHPQDPIVEAVYIRLGKTYEELQNQTEAIAAYQKILENYPESIYTDEALIFSAQIYETLGQPDKAQLLLEKIITTHPDSIYFNEAQQKFRQLRGDKQL
jgi:tetratricopeptide (TPR) repeat protein